MRKNVIILLIFGWLMMPLSCTEHTPDLSISNIGVTIGKISDAEYATSYLVLEPIDFEVSEEPLASTEFGMELYVVDYEQIAWTFFNHTFPIYTAMADEPEPFVRDRISLISITATDTIHTINNVYAPGAVLNDLFQVGNRKGYPQTIQDYIEQSVRWWYYESILLNLFASLERPFDHSFIIKVILEDGTVFDLETPIVRLN